MLPRASSLSNFSTRHRQLAASTAIRDVTRGETERGEKKSTEKSSERKEHDEHNVSSSGGMASSEFVHVSHVGEQFVKL